MQKATEIGEQLIDALSEGQEIADPTKWKYRGILVGAITGALSALVTILKMLGFDFPITDGEIIVYSGLFATFIQCVLIVFTLITSKKVGLYTLWTRIIGK